MTQSNLARHLACILGPVRTRVPLLLGLLVPVLGACGSDLYQTKRKPRCKVNCEPTGPEQRQADGTVRTSIGLPMAPQDWVNATPLTSFEDQEILQMLVANPVVVVGKSDPSFSPMGQSMEAGLAMFEKSLAAAFAIADDKRASNPAADCYRKQFERLPAVTGDAVVYELNPALCFTVEQLQQSLKLNSAEEAKTTRALVYEEAYRLSVPLNQGQFSLSDSALAQPLLAFLRDTQVPILPLKRAISQSLRVANVARLEATGLERRSGQGPAFFELTWDFLSLGGAAGDSGFRLTENVDPASQALTWAFRGSLVHSRGNARDPNALKIGGAAEAVGFARVVTFLDFAVSFPKDSAARANGRLPSPAQAFAKGTDAIMTGAFSVVIPQPSQVLRFTAKGLGEPCRVEVFAGTDTTRSDSSLGALDLCSSVGLGL